MSWMFLWNLLPLVLLFWAWKSFSSDSTGKKTATGHETKNVEKSTVTPPDESESVVYDRPWEPGPANVNHAGVAHRHD